VYTAETIERSVWFGGDSGLPAGREDGVETFDDERGMRALSGSEFELDAKVKIYGAGHEPDAFALGHLRRLFYLGEAEDARVERAGAAFASDRNSDLYVVEATDRHCVNP
jgi:hypothetical protein